MHWFNGIVQRRLAMLVASLIVIADWCLYYAQFFPRNSVACLLCVDTLIMHYTWQPCWHKLDRSVNIFSSENQVQVSLTLLSYPNKCLPAAAIVWFILCHPVYTFAFNLSDIVLMWCIGKQLCVFVYVCVQLWCQQRAADMSECLAWFQPLHVPSRLRAAPVCSGQRSRWQAEPSVKRDGVQDSRHLSRNDSRHAEGRSVSTMSSSSSVERLLQTCRLLSYGYNTIQYNVGI